METKNASKVNFTLKSENSSYDFTIIDNNKEITLKIEDLKEFPIKIYELKIELEKLKQIDDNFLCSKQLKDLLMQLNHAFNLRIILFVLTKKKILLFYNEK